jgi:tRNA-Thr(GGU) m(6)t(6)A37 methyltransferase TsaA
MTATLEETETEQTVCSGKTARLDNEEGAHARHGANGNQGKVADLRSRGDEAAGMNGQGILFFPIGVIRSEHRVARQTPIQPAYAKGCKGRVELFPQFIEGVRDLEGFSHLYLIFHFDRAEPGKLIVKPFLQDVERGVFSTRAPCRPNPIGLSVVELISIEGHVLHLDSVDILDGTPLLDIKPYTAKFDRIATTRNGWQDEIDEATAQRLGRREHSADVLRDRTF